MLPCIIIGGGLAGLTAGLRLARAGIEACLVEPKAYPFHRVCGEYVSLEVLPLLESLGADPMGLGAQLIRRLEMAAPSGKRVQLDLPLGAFSVSRYALDAHLAGLAREADLDLRLGERVRDVRFEGDHFSLTLASGTELQARTVIGAFGKRSALDRTLARPFFARRSPFIGVKYHLQGDYPPDLVGVYHFDGGYCGVSRVEGADRLNVCYLGRREALRAHGSLEAMEAATLLRQPQLQRLFAEAKSLFERPLVINEISFAPKAAVEDHLLMAGDAAGLITPICGNGMAMAIQGGYWAAEAVAAFLPGQLSRAEMEARYTAAWRRQFGRRLWVGRRVQASLRPPWLAETAVGLMRRWPGAARQVVKLTHGGEEDGPGPPGPTPR